MAELESSNICCIHEATNNNEVSLVIPRAHNTSCISSEDEQDAVGLPSAKGIVGRNACQSCATFEPGHKHHDDGLINKQLDSDDKSTLDVPELLSKYNVEDVNVEQTEPVNNDGELDCANSLTSVDDSVTSVETEQNFLPLAKCLDEVGLYAYITTVAHSLFVLYTYNKWNRNFQELCVKQLLEHLKLPEQMENTLMLVTRGHAVLRTMDPFFSAIKKQQYVQKNGMEVILVDMLNFSLEKGYYDARMRVLIKYTSQCLGIRTEALDEIENIVAKTFTEDRHEVTPEELKVMKRKERKTLIKRVALISLATVGGGVAIGLTGGLVAPLIAAGAGAVIGGAGAAALGSVAGAAIIGSLFGAAGAGLTGYKMNKRVGSLKEFEFEPLSSGLSLHITIAVSGWLSDENPDFKSAWVGLRTSNEQYVLRYESESIKELGRAFEYVFMIGVKAAVRETLKFTVLGGLVAAIAWPVALIGASSIIDNPWSVCTERSVLAGKQLAEVLLARHQGRRPVNLIGFSFGARVIFACLQEMAKRKNCEGIIEEVILLGAPVSGDVNAWRAFERVVSGKIVNGYCRTDWLLKFMYRAGSVQLSVAGLSPVDWNHRLMYNVDLTEMVTGHLEYAKNMDEILKVIVDKTKSRVELGGVGVNNWVDSVTQLTGGDV